MRHWTVLIALLPALAIAEAPVPGPREVLALDEAMHRFIRQQVAARAASPSARQALLLEAVFGPEGLALTYDDATTRTVAETFHSGRGNCLSFTLMYVAMAQALGLDVAYQEVDEAVWQRRGETVLRTAHINVLLRLDGREQVVDFEPDARFARTSVRRVGEARALAHFYSNRGMELLLEGQAQAALPWVRRATELDADFVPAWSNLGVALRQSGREAEAEAAYLRALALDPEHAQTLSNLVGLYERWRDEPRKAGYVLRLQDVEKDDPYAVFALGREQEQAGNLAAAARHFRRAIRLHEADSSFHLALFRVYHRLGRLERAAASLMRASELDEDRPRAIYARKFALLGVQAGPATQSTRAGLAADRVPMGAVSAPPGQFPVMRRY